MEKICPSCQMTKPLDEFHVDRSRPDGHYFYCKTCTRAKVRSYSRRPEAPRFQSPEGMRHCQKCKATKPVADFYESTHYADGYVKICKECWRAETRERRAKDPQKHRDQVKRWRDANKTLHADMNARWKYGIATGTYADMLTAQNGQCAICGTADTGKMSRFHIDHCHDTDVVRGLLCSHCNTGIGQFRHRKDLLEAAIRYLDKSAVSSTES